MRGLLENLEDRSKEEILAHLPTLLDLLGDSKANSNDI